MEPLIELKDFRYVTPEGRVVFERADLRLYPGEKALLTGPVGSGKNTLLRILAGVTAPSGGSVMVLGTDLSTCDVAALNSLRRRMGFVFHDNVLISNLKVIENVALPILYHTAVSYDDAMGKAVRLLGRTGYRGDLWELPGGLGLFARKTIAVARALALDPDVVICESLAEGLSEHEASHLMEALNEYHSTAGSLMLFTSRSDADARLIRPGRIIRIEGLGFKG